MRSNWIRRLAGATALAVGLAVVAADAAARDHIPAAAAEKAIEADAAHLKQLFELAKTKKKLEGRMKATALLIATYAQDNATGPNANKMAATRAQALQVAEAVAKKNLAAAQKAAEGLPGGAAAGKADTKKMEPAELAKTTKLELHELMDLFGGSVGGGMNIEKDIRTAKKNGPNSAAEAALIGARTAAIADFTMVVTPEFGGKKTKGDWDRWTKDMKTHATAIAEEATKAKPDLTKIKGLMGKLDATCTNCHNVFRDE